MPKTKETPVDFTTLEKEVDLLKEMLVQLTTGELLNKAGAKRKLLAYRKLLQKVSAMIKGARRYAIDIEQSLLSRKESSGIGVDDSVITQESKVDVPEEPV
jgi:hypothetical protein